MPNNSLEKKWLLSVPCGDKEALVVFHNVSQRKQLEFRLSRALESAELSNRAKTDFIATVSHELRTPLNAVLGFSELLDIEFNLLPDEEKKQLLHQIQQSGKVLLALVNELLELARIDSGNLNLNLKSVDIPTIVRESAGLLQSQLKTKKQELSLELPSQGLEMLVDRDRVKQMLINLLGNASKFSPVNGKVRVRVEVTSSEQVEISVADSGPGVSEDARGSIFDRFARGNGLDNSHRRVEGTGLGLSIVKGLIEAHGGSIRVTCPGVGEAGATFILTLPLTFR